MKILHTSIVVVALGAAAGLAWWVQNRPASSSVAATDVAASAPGRPGSGPGGPGGPGPGGPGGGGGPAAVEVAKVETGRVEDDAQAVGTLRSNQGVMMRPEVSGRIAKLTFRDGERVRRGQLLVQLDDSLQQAQLQQAEAQAGIARTQLQRNRELQAQSFVSQSAVDQAVANLQVAEAQVALAKAQVARMRIVAPFDGITGIRVVNTGDYVKDGADMVNIEDLSSVVVDFRLPERYLSRLKAGQGVQIDIDAMPGRRFGGKVEALDSQLDANGRSVLVRARIANAGGELRAGMFARPRIVFDVREAALLVPEEALVPVGDKQFIFKVVDGEKGGKVAKRTAVRLGQRLAGKVELLDGVSAGELVVVAGQSRLMRGESPPVRVVDLNRPGGPRGARGPGGGASGAASGPAGQAASGAPGPVARASGNATATP